MYCQRASHIALHDFHPDVGWDGLLALSYSHFRGRLTKISSVFDSNEDTSDEAKNIVGQI